MDKRLLKEVTTLLKAYYGDIEFWQATRDYEGVNYVTAGTECFDCDEDVRAYRTRVKAILKEVEEEASSLQ